MLDWLAKLATFVQERYPDILTAAQEHLLISLTAVVLGCAIAIPLGILLAMVSNKWLHGIVFGVVNVFQTIPSLALLAIMIPLLGIGIMPAIIALLLYSLLPILRNTYAGFQSVDPAIIESAKGMGYSALQRLLSIQLPLAFPYMMSGIRVTTVYVISWTTLAAMIGAGGLGVLIFSGLGVHKNELIIVGAVCAILLALAADTLLGFMERRIAKKANPAKSGTFAA